ncbi:MAG TPA: AMP-binding protein [Burkholderiaceae bacterium]|jgi:acyl-CoA synthetase (AMP-forming)/AMP-acid ligase II
MFNDAPSLSSALRAAFERHAAADRTALVFGDEPTSYAELGRRIDAMACALRAWGVERGEPIALLVPRNVDAVVLFFAIIQAGACACVLEPRLAAAEIGLRLAAVGVRKLVLDPAELPDAPALAPSIDARAPADLLRAAGHAAAALDPPLAPEERAMMQFTSGSTGQPKGVLLSHANLLANARGVLAHTGTGPGDRLLHLMPLHHTNGINNQLIVPLLAGASVVLVERFRADAVADLIARHRPTYLTGVPTMYARMLPHLADRSKLASLRFLRCGSAPITPTLHEQIEAAFGVPLVVSYGLSESTCTTTMNPPHARRIGSVGTVLDGQALRLFQANTTREVAAGSEGEVCIAGPCLMMGYVGAGAEQPVRDGWLRTGDVGRFDADGYLRITGRIKDIIIRGGENIAPQSIESVLATHASVKACCVVAGPHADLGEVPVAFVVLHDGRAATAAELQALVGARLSRICVPAELRFVDALPENAVGKLDRKALAQRLSAAPAR